MLSFVRIEKIAGRTAEVINWVASFALMFMMMLTVADVVLRFFRMPIPGTYEIVGFVGAIVVAFALPYTSIQRGHIAVDFLMNRLPWLARVIFNIINAFFAMVLFGVIAWQCVLQAERLRAAGEVSATLQMPVYPFVYGTAVGCALLCPVLLLEILRQFKGAEIQ